MRGGDFAVAVANLFAIRKTIGDHGLQARHEGLAATRIKMSKIFTIVPQPKFMPSLIH
jgi:hypothetical protein